MTIALICVVLLGFLLFGLGFAVSASRTCSASRGHSGTYLFGIALCVQIFLSV